MPDIMTDKEIAELRALEAKATPGPWSAMRAIAERFYGDWSRRSRPSGGGYIRQTMPPLSDEDQFARYEDAAFIAAARNALPRLLAMLDAERAEVARLRGFVDFVTRIANNDALNFAEKGIIIATHPTVPAALKGGDDA